MATRKQIKEQAQEELLLALQTAWDRLSDYDRDLDHEVLAAEMDRQMMRIEKLFGFEPGSWRRGC